MKNELNDITGLLGQARERAFRETSDAPEPHFAGSVQWPLNCTVGPGLEGAIACESKVGYVNGSKGWLIYRGYNIFDLCAHSTFEEVSYLLLYGALPTLPELQAFRGELVNYRSINQTLRRLMGFPVEEMNAMAALRLGTNLVREEFTQLDQEDVRPAAFDAIGSDEDSIAMETVPKGTKHATYEFKQKRSRQSKRNREREKASGVDACCHLIAGVATIAAAIARIHQGKLPIEPDPELGHAANFLYMITGSRPSAAEERIMDIALILHADHGMNASTFASMVTASTLSDIYFSVGSGIAALSGPLHGGANEQVMRTIKQIGSVGQVKPWVEKMLRKKSKVSGFGHRVYKAYDPRARILGPLAQYLIGRNADPGAQQMLAVARELEREVVSRLGTEKKIFPNVDFYSGIVYSALGLAEEMFTPIFAVSRVAGWTARVLEYLENNRIFRPRALYSGEFNNTYVPIEQRDGHA